MTTEVHGRARQARAFAGAVILGGALALAAACYPISRRSPLDRMRVPWPNRLRPAETG